MADLFRKLNTLIKAKANDVLDDVTPSNIRPVNPFNRKLDENVETLRQRINEAIAHEDHLQAQVNALADEVARLDAEADKVVKQGNDAAARHLIEQMQRAQQRRTMAESDLQEHRIVAQDLIQRVNLLEATVADARYSDAQSEDVPDSAQAVSPVDRLGGAINEAREKLASMSQKMTAAENLSVNDDQPVDNQAVDDDLEARRNRLSKR